MREAIESAVHGYFACCRALVIIFEQCSRDKYLLYGVSLSDLEETGHADSLVVVMGNGGTCGAFLDIIEAIRLFNLRKEWIKPLQKLYIDLCCIQISHGFDRLKQVIGDHVFPIDFSKHIRYVEELACIVTGQNNMLGVFLENGDVIEASDEVLAQVVAYYCLDLPVDNQEEKKDNFVIGIELLKIIRPTAAELIMECLEEN